MQRLLTYGILVIVNMSIFDVPKPGVFASPQLLALAESSGTFDPHGDLRLVVGHDKAESLVCSRSLARASPVFRNMLYGRFSEAMPARGEWRVELPEDDPNALCFLFNIIHGRFDRIANGIGAVYADRDIYEVAILTDKYDLTHMLRPWANSWLNDIANRHRRDFTSRIWIAWEMGDYKLFAAECENLYLNAAIDSDGNLLDASGTRLDTCPMLENLDILGEYLLILNTSRRCSVCGSV